MTEPKIVPSSDEEEVLEAIKNINLQEISLFVDWLWREWGELDEHLVAMGYPRIKDGMQYSLLERVKDYADDGPSK